MHAPASYRLSIAYAGFSSLLFCCFQFSAMRAFYRHVTVQTERGTRVPGKTQRCDICIGTRITDKRDVTTVTCWTTRSAKVSDEHAAAFTVDRWIMVHMENSDQRWGVERGQRKRLQRERTQRTRQKQAAQETETEADEAERRKLRAKELRHERTVDQVATERAKHAAGEADRRSQRTEQQVAAERARMQNAAERRDARSEEHMKQNAAACRTAKPHASSTAI
jgi:hypothetical protein